MPKEEQAFAGGPLLLGAPTALGCAGLVTEAIRTCLYVQAMFLEAKGCRGWGVSSVCMRGARGPYRSLRSLSSLLTSSLPDGTGPALAQASCRSRLFCRPKT